MEFHQILHNLMSLYFGQKSFITESTWWRFSKIDLISHFNKQSETESHLCRSGVKSRACVFIAQNVEKDFFMEFHQILHDLMSLYLAKILLLLNLPGGVLVK